MVAPDAVLMADRPAVLDDRLAGGGLQATPAVEGLVGLCAESEDVRRVEAGAARVDVGQVAERVDPLAAAVAFEAVAERPPHRRGKVRQTPPVDGRLECVDRVAEVPQRVAQVRGPEPVPEPLTAERAADAGPAVAPDDRADLPHGRLDELLQARGGDEQEARLRADPAEAEPRPQGPDAASVAGQGEEGRRFERGREPDHRQRQPRPADVAGGLERARPVGQEPGRDRLDARLRYDADGRLGQDSEPALGSEYELAQVRTGRGCRMGRQVDRAGRGLQPAAREERLDPSEPHRLLAGRAGRHPAADGRALPGLWEVAQRQAVWRERGLDVRPERARPE